MPSSRTPLALTLTAVVALTMSACSDDAPEVAQPDSPAGNAQVGAAEVEPAQTESPDAGTDGDHADAAEGNSSDDAPDGEAQDGAPHGEAAGYQVGEEVQVGDWVVVVTDVAEDASDVLLAESELNEPPAQGRQFVLVTVETTYTGTATGTAWVDLTLSIDGADGTTYAGGVDDYCGIIPNSLFDMEAQSPGASATGTVCAALPADQVTGSRLGLETFATMDGERQFVELAPRG